MKQHETIHPEERGPPLHFAGREAELKQFKRFMANNDPSVGMRVVTGIPGIGKTQLLERFDEEARKANMATLKLQCGSLSISDAELFMELAEAIGEKDAGEKIAHKDPRQTGKSLRFRAVGVGGGVGENIEHARQEPGLNAMLTALAKKLPKKPPKIALWKRAPKLVVTIDELQNLDEEGGKRLRVLHEGRHGCPILIVGAGLQLTIKRLVECGISRTATPMELKRLSESETYEAVVKGYANGTKSELDDEVAEELARASMRFPQHIVGYLEGAIQTFEAYGDVCINRIDEVMKHGEMAKQRYYKSRLNAVDGIDNVLELVEMFHKDKPVSIGAVREGLRERGIEPEAKLDIAIQHGLLTQGEDGMLSIDIPSFWTYLKATARTYKENTLSARRDGLGRD